MCECRGLISASNGPRIHDRKAFRGYIRHGRGRLEEVGRGGVGAFEEGSLLPNKGLAGSHKPPSALVVVSGNQSLRRAFFFAAQGDERQRFFRWWRRGKNAAFGLS